MGHGDTALEHTESTEGKASFIVRYRKWRRKESIPIPVTVAMLYPYIKQGQQQATQQSVLPNMSTCWPVYEVVEGNAVACVLQNLWRGIYGV